MYSLQKAAAILSISERTVRDWMKRLGIEGKIVETNRRRRYLSHSDMLELADHVFKKVVKNESEKNNRKLNNRYRIIDDKNAYSSVNTGERFYSLAGAASLLGVAVNTLQKWIKQHNIEKKVISTDRKRVYISHNNVIRLADLYERKVPLKEHADIPPQREVNAVQNDMDKLYSIKEAALCLNVAQTTLREWIRQGNIEKTSNTTDKRRTYITYKNVLKLADLHNRELILNSAPVDVVAEVQEIKSILKKHASAIEDLIHDFKLFAKRAIYVA